MDLAAAYREFLDQCVVIDVESPVVYIGRLLEANECFVTLADVDIHDLRNSTVSKEVYVMEAAQNGIQPNRRIVKVKQSEVLSISRLSDVIVY